MSQHLEAFDFQYQWAQIYNNDVYIPAQRYYPKVNTNVAEPSQTHCHLGLRKGITLRYFAYDFDAEVQK